MSIDDPYTVLGVTPGASAADLKRAYYRLSHQWHPDHHMQADEAQRRRAEQMFMKIGHAYVVVSTALGSRSAGQTTDVPAGQAVTVTSPAASARQTLRERQLHEVALACSASRLMIIAQTWTINPYTFRREVALVRRILSDAVVWGFQAFPEGF